MRTTRLFLTMLAAGVLAGCDNAPQVELVSSTMDAPWQTAFPLEGKAVSDSTVVVDITKTKQPIEGFGACFNELGWTSLSLLSEADRDGIFHELYAPGVGANFTMNRMPIASNDFSLDYYSYDDVDGDFDLEHFSIAHDEATLLPFIRAAKAENPDLRIWASPWCPPAWLKTNKHYACTSTEAFRQRFAAMMRNRPAGADQDNLGFASMFEVDNGLSPDNQLREGEDGFTQDPKYLETYARYFGKFIDAYRAQGIDIYMVMPQNEPNSAQWYPACTWTPEGLASFIKYLGPEMEKRGVDVYLGTIERADPAMWERILTNAEAAPYIKGMGFQWAGKDALPTLHQKYPQMNLYQSEQECGNGKNDLAGAQHSWDLMKHYLTNGVTGYFYWNISLLEGGVSHWGWRQNSLVTVNEADKTFTYTPEYYVMKHVSHFVLPGAKLIDLGGTYGDALGFLNEDGSVVVVLANQSEEEKDVTVFINDHTQTLRLAPQSLSTLTMK